MLLSGQRRSQGFKYFNNVRANLTGDYVRTIERNADVLLNACKDIGLTVSTGKTILRESSTIEV